MCFISAIYFYEYFSVFDSLLLASTLTKKFNLNELNIIINKAGESGHVAVRGGEN